MSVPVDIWYVNSHGDKDFDAFCSDKKVDQIVTDVLEQYCGLKDKLQTITIDGCLIWHNGKRVDG